MDEEITQSNGTPHLQLRAPVQQLQPGGLSLSSGTVLEVFKQWLFSGAKPLAGLSFIPHFHSHILKLPAARLPSSRADCGLWTPFEV